MKKVQIGDYNLEFKWTGRKEDDKQLKVKYTDNNFNIIMNVITAKTASGGYSYKNSIQYELDGRVITNKKSLLKIMDNKFKNPA